MAALAGLIVRRWPSVSAGSISQWSPVWSFSVSTCSVSGTWSAAGSASAAHTPAVPARTRFDQPSEVLGMTLTGRRSCSAGFVLLLIFGLAAKNLMRSKIGRALSAIRDRDLQRR